MLPLFFVTAITAQTPTLNLPARNPNAPTGSQFAKQIEDLPLEQREREIYAQVKQGNIPNFLRHLAPVEIQNGPVETEIYVAPDVLAIGTDADYFDVPLTPYTAQEIADLTDCTLPTPKISDAIYAQAPLKMTPSPIPPSSAMTTVPVFEQINTTIRDQREKELSEYPLGTLVAGDKKDVVICKGLKDRPGHVAIYGWHTAIGKPIQPLYLGHDASWADYSHGIRLVSRQMEIEKKPCDIETVLQDPVLANLVSGEGVISQPRYVFSSFPKDWSNTIRVPEGEKVETLYPAENVRVVIDEPGHLERRVELVLYALPNGNTIEQTFGRKMKAGMEWHFDIQHIGAQTRFLRGLIHDRSLVVAYLQSDQKSWPTWIGKHSAGDVVSIVEAITHKFEGHDLSVVLDSHSGGGAFLFAYIRAVPKIPDQIQRIAFLDSEYDYDTNTHEKKIADWLRVGGHYLCLIAYDDASALYNGKPFVSANGGTWGRTHAMLSDLGQDFPIQRVNDTDPEKYTGLDGRITFWLKQNPGRQILHTVQVEKNGFIESLLSGTPLEGEGYSYFGDRAYSQFVGP